MTGGELFGPDPAEGAPQPGTCRSCGAPIVWIRTVASKPMPCDPAVRTVITDAGLTVRGRESHFATCPQAGEHRKPAATGPGRVHRRG